MTVEEEFDNYLVDRTRKRPFCDIHPTLLEVPHPQEKNVQGNVSLLFRWRWNQS
jgi:hypothetical protein